MIEAKVVEVTLNRDYQAGRQLGGVFGTRTLGRAVSRGTLLQQSFPAGGERHRNRRGLDHGQHGRVHDYGPAVGSFPGNDLINFTNPAASCSGCLSDPELRVIDHLSRDAGAVQVLSSPRVRRSTPESGPQGRNRPVLLTSITGTPIASIAGGRSTRFK